MFQTTNQMSYLTETHKCTFNILYWELPLEAGKQGLTLPDELEESISISPKSYDLT